MLKNKKIFLPKLISFKKYSEKGGYLVPFENVKKRINLGNNCPIKIRRIFFSSGKKGSFRGDHAHKRCSQLLLCVNGSIKIETIFHTKIKKNYYISKNKNKALLLPPLVWSRIYFKNEKSLLVVICDYKYDNKNEYINSFKEFINISKKKFK
jgi:dTDP-4-dehydrorhamnose 3,5-epimerase-like enzyme